MGPAYVPVIKINLKRIAGDSHLKIPACDHTREIIGNVEPKSAAALCPLLDSNIRMRTECRIGTHPKQPGEEPGQPISRAYQFDIVLYGPMKYCRSVGSHLKRHNQQLVAPMMVQKGIRVVNPHASDFRPTVVPGKSSSSSSLSAGPVSTTIRTVEEVRSQVMGVFDSLTRSEDLPEAVAPATIITPLLRHQRQGLYFMLKRELSAEEQTKEAGMVSFWQQKVDGTGQKRYFNVITGQSQVKQPNETRGGILADMMGLGKTLSILALVMSTLDAAHAWLLHDPMQVSNDEVPHHADTGIPPPSTLGLTTANRTSRATLLVCPVSTVTNWEEQIKQHIKGGALSYHIYHGPQRIKDAARLADFDLVITTFGSISNELQSRRKGKSGPFPLEEISWFRIVLDEAHTIREQSTLMFKSTCRLAANRKWAVTGTPVQNRLDDLGALFAFLRLDPFHDRNKFNRYVIEPFRACDPEIVPKMRVLVDAVTLRRLKDKIDLPPREDLVVKLNFSEDERQIYDMFARNAQDRVQVLANSQRARGLGGNSYIHILKAILRLRLLCAHGKDLLSVDDLASLQGMTADMAISIDEDDDDSGPSLSHHKALEMLKLMIETNNDACISCNMKLAVDENAEPDEIIGFMTPCFHLVCQSCIRAYQELAQSCLIPGQSAGPCHICSAHIKLEFVELRASNLETETSGLPRRKLGHNKILPKYEGPHTKTKALLEDLLKSEEQTRQNPTEKPYKSVVFTAWTSHLDLIGYALTAAGISFVRLDGTMQRPARTAVMTRFREDDSVHVMLVSITAGGLGLNLTAGNSVYVMEPQFNPAAEAQAVDRVHRLGQKRPVRTVRYIMRDSFEEKMVELQDKKKKLASLSIDGEKKLDKDEAARQKLMDIRSLFK